MFDYKAVLAWAARDILKMIAGFLVAHGYLDGSGVEGFIGAGMVIASVGWTWWVKSGQQLVLARLAKMHAMVPRSAPTAVAAKAAVQQATKAAAVVLFVMYGLGALAPSPSYAATAPKPAIAADVLAKIATDAQAAAADATANNDTIAAACYNAIAQDAQAKASASSTTGAGLLLAFQKVRDVTRMSSSPSGTNLIVGCAPLVQDAKLNFLQFFTNIGAAVLLKGLLLAP